MLLDKHILIDGAHTILPPKRDHGEDRATTSDQKKATWSPFLCVDIMFIMIPNEETQPGRRVMKNSHLCTHISPFRLSTGFFFLFWKVASWENYWYIGIALLIGNNSPSYWISVGLLRKLPSYRVRPRMRAIPPCSSPGFSCYSVLPLAIFHSKHYSNGESQHFIAVFVMMGDSSFNVLLRQNLGVQILHFSKDITDTGWSLSYCRY